jgi:hypothetical protein
VTAATTETALEDLVAVYRTADAMLLAIVKSALEAADVRFVVQGEGGLGLFPLGPLATGLTKNLVQATIYVAPEDETRALEVLEGVDSTDES